MDADRQGPQLELVSDVLATPPMGRPEAPIGEEMRAAVGRARPQGMSFGMPPDTGAEECHISDQQSLSGDSLKQARGGQHRRGQLLKLTFEKCLLVDEDRCAEVD